jgi:hypothetical protein
MSWCGNVLLTIRFLEEEVVVAAAAAAVTAAAAVIDQELI